MATTIEIANEIADATVAVAKKLESMAADSHALLTTSREIALSAYGAAHPNLSGLTASGVAALQESKENN